jgi:hypothetical protein
MGLQDGLQALCLCASGKGQAKRQGQEKQTKHQGKPIILQDSRSGGIPAPHPVQ